MAKKTQAQVGYVNRSDVRGERCGLCSMFRAPYGCTAVTGHIKPGGWCELFDRKVQRADGGAVPMAEGGAPAFDPGKPFESIALGAGADAPPAFDPGKPFAAAPVAPPMTALETARDVAASGGIGVVKGGLGLAGLSGDARGLISGLANKASKAMGYEVSPEAVSAVLKHASPAGVLAGPTSAQTRGALETVTGPLYEPKTMPGRYAETAGEFVPAVVGGPEALAIKAATRVAAPAVAGQSGAELTRGTAAEPYAKALLALTGAVGASGLASAVRGAVSPKTNVAADLARAIERDGETPQVLLQKLEEVKTIRPEATLADVGGENVRGLVERVAQTPGAGRTTVIPALTERQQGQMGRVSNDLVDLTGTRKTATQAIEETMAARRSDAAPLYDIAMDFNARRVPEVVRAWEQETAQGWGKQVLSSSDFRRTLQTEYGITDATNAPLMKVIDSWKKGVDDLVSAAQRSGNNNRARVLGDMRDRVISVLDEHNPAYAQARNAWAGPSKYLDAIGDGRNILSNKVSAEELATKLGAMSEAEREAYRIGAVSAIRGKMGNDPAKLADMTKYLRSPEVRDKIAAMMPTAEAAENFAKRLNFEVGSSEMTGRALGNSATARRLAERADADSIVGDLVIGALGHGPTLGLLRHTLMALPNRVRDTLRSRSDRVMADVLTQPQTPASVRSTMEAVSDQGGRSPMLPAVPAAVYGESGVPGHARGGKVVKNPWHPAQTGAKRARDGQWYLPDPDRPGKYLRVERKAGGASRKAS